jgi:hypothetical protein
MATKTTPGQIINECRFDIWRAIYKLNEVKDYGNADSLILEAARCGDMHEWMSLREEALAMVAV